jgi:hypothetical protein
MSFDAPALRYVALSSEVLLVSMFLAPSKSPLKFRYPGLRLLIHTGKRGAEFFNSDFSVNLVSRSLMSGRVRCLSSLSCSTSTVTFHLWTQPSW